MSPSQELCEEREPLLSGCGGEYDCDQIIESFVKDKKCFVIKQEGNANLGAWK